MTTGLHKFTGTRAVTYSSYDYGIFDRLAQKWCVGFAGGIEKKPAPFAGFDFVAGGRARGRELVLRDGGIEFCLQL